MKTIEIAFHKEKKDESAALFIIDGSPDAFITWKPDQSRILESRACSQKGMVFVVSE